MKLSIITINLNNREGLQKTIDSVISQTFHDFEWIIIDGGSTDGSRELIEHNPKYFAYWVSEPDNGVYHAMNKGVKVAKGEYIQFLNSGDWLWDKDVLEKTFSFDPTADILYADFNFTRDNKLIRPRHYPDILSLREFLDHGMCHNSSFFKKEILLNNPYNESLSISSDNEIYIKAILENYSLFHIPVVLIGYDTTGISSNYQLGEKEANLIRKLLISPGIQKDMDKLHYLESLPKNKVLMEVDSYRENYRFYHKMITVSLLLMRLINKIFKRSSVNSISE